ncbi:MAG: cobalamin biosynthesis protein, partial [Actinomycetes bacterium]
MVGLVAVTAAGGTGAARLATAWPGRTRTYPPPVGEALARAFAECDAVVAFLATGATVRLIAPLLAGKLRDPGVVCVDEAHRYAVALLGGHAGGANALAREIADVLGVLPVVTTGSDATGITALDELGWPVEGDVAGVARALLDGDPVHLDADSTWPLPALPATVGEHPESTYRLRVTDRIVAPAAGEVVLRPPSLVLGAGASRGVSAEEVLELLDTVLTEAGVSPASVRHLATVEAKAEETGLQAAARARGWPLVTHPADVLDHVPVPHPSQQVWAAVGTGSVAEAAAVLGGGRLLVGKRRSDRPVPQATAALARHAPSGRLALVGLGPGARDLMTGRAHAELRRASVVVGLDQYVDQVRDLLRPGTRVVASGLGEEEQRGRTAVELARAGHAVALIGSGDAGVYAMASPALLGADEAVEVVGVPGVTAALAAAALLGAPLGHDHASVSLSDLHTPWSVIEGRLRAA